MSRWGGVSSDDHVSTRVLADFFDGSFTAAAINAIEGEATIEFQQPTVISTKSGAGVLTLKSVGNSLILDAGIDIRLKKDVLFFDNKKFWIGTSKDYWFEYSTSDSRLLLKSRDIDGVQTEGVIFCVLDGTQVLQFLGAIQTDIIDEFTADAGITLDGVELKDGLVDGRDIVTDGAKLDGIESSAEVATKEFFISAGAAILSSNASYNTPNNVYAVSLADAVSFARCFFTFRLPSDFSSMTAGYPKVVFMQGTGGTGNYRISFDARNGEVGEQLSDELDSIAEYTMVAPGQTDELWEEDIAAAFDGLSLAAGDYVGLQIQRDSDDSLDTFAGDLDVLGVVVKYD